MSQLPLLGICIPTYRRPDQLRRCVTSIIRTAAPHGVPIHITDDSADDTNSAVIAELQACYPRVFHHRNPTNLGIDANICRAVDVCDARHAWIIGEDDRMTPEAVPTVLGALQSGERPFIFVNYASVDEDLSFVLHERSLPLVTDREVDAGEYFASDAWAMGFIGACVVDRQLWRGVSRDQYLGTYYAHVGVILEYLRGKRVYQMAKPVVLNRCGTARTFTWTGSTFEVLGGWGRMVDRLRRIYPAEICDRAAASFLRAHGVGTIPFFCYLRADGALDASIHERYVQNGPYPVASRCASWWIARTSPALFQAARWGLNRLRKARSRPLRGY